MNPSVQLKWVMEEQESNQPMISRTNKYGKLIPLMMDARGHPRLMLGPNYIVFFIAFGFCLFMLGWLIYNFMDKFTLFWNVLVFVSSSSFLLAYLKMGFSKPGVQLPKHEATPIERESLRFCSVCEIVREARTQHCQDCDVCILGCDHHCPWVGKCVGRDNQCAFYIFLVLTFVNLVVVFVATALANIESSNAKANLQ